MASQLHIIMANHLEVLADAIATLVAEPPENCTDPLQPETVLIQSKGMQQWVSMAIADRNGICANIEFPFPNTFLGQLYEQVLGERPQQQFFDAKVQTFRIMALLPQLLEKDEFEPIRRYLNNASADRKQFQLAAQIADVFDQYQIFRPEMLLQWESGRNGKLTDANMWQPILWNALGSGAQSSHRAALQKELIRILTQAKSRPKRLPSKIAVFGISHLPPFHLQVLAALAQRIPVYLFLLNPCRQYWGDIVSDRQLFKSKKKVASDIDPVKDLHIERGNRLLATWGGQGRQFFNLIHQMDGQIVEAFEDTPRQSLLVRIQQDILDLNDRVKNDAEATPIEDDGSVQIHVCHSPMREVEVLHDQLLNMLENDSSLDPRDILVMAPDIERYAPYIQAVFNSAQNGETVIPYTVADQGMVRESRLIESFLALLGLHRSRYQVSQVLALLAYPHIRQCFGLEEVDLPKIERWLGSANIRWGWDGAHRKTHSLPRFEHNTWRHGMDRLVLGYAMAGDGSKLFNGILPQEEMDTSDGQILGSFFSFVEKLYRQLVALPDSARISFWHKTLMEVLDEFFRVDDACANEMKALRDIVDELDKSAALAGFTQEVPFEVVLDFLNRTLSRASFGTGFIAGSVTFCAMLPMRSIPAKVICILGMGYDAFPRDMREPAFNLIAAEPAAGDRSKRDDDKYLFLEALISARKRLYLSYVGRNIQDNSPIPPSVLIDELLEYMEEGYSLSAARVVTLHPLQAFSPRYFNASDPKLFSYSKENFEASQAFGKMDGPLPFFSETLNLPQSRWRNCPLDQFLAFFANPARFLLEQRLGIFMRKDAALLEDQESFNLDPLARFKIRQSMLDCYIQDRDVEQNYQSLLAAGMLPHGNVGRVLFNQMAQDVQLFVARLNQHLVDVTKVASHPFDLKIGLFHLSGTIGGIYPEKRGVYRLAKMRPQDLLSLFIAHLIMAEQPNGEMALQNSVIICQDAQWQLGPVANAHDILHQYLELYWQGLQYPLPLFPTSSYAYALKRHQGKPSGQALSSARGKWRGSPPYVSGDDQDAYLNLCFSDSDPLNEAFEQTALEVFGPVLASVSKL